MSAAPGWYDDPDGVPGRQRWWDGSAWGDLTQGGPTYGASGSAYGGAAYGGPAYGSHASGHGAVATKPPRTLTDVIGSPERPPWRDRPGLLPGLLIGGAVLVIVLLAVTLVTGRSADPVAGPGVPTFPTFPSDPTQDPPGTFPPGTVRIIDSDAGLSYAYLGEGWREVNFGQRPEMITTHGQYIVTQETTPDGGSFIAEVSSGPLAEQFVVAGPPGFPAAIESLTDSFRSNYYPAPNELDVLSSEPVTLDGAPGYLLRFDLTWDVAGYESTGERVALLLLDTGRERPAVVYISIPNTHAELYGIIDQVVASILVLA